MSGGADIPKAPDLSGNVDAANATYKTATSNAAQTMSAAQALNQNANAHMQQVAGAELPMVNNVNDAANKSLSNYSNTFSALQQQQADQAKNYTSEENIKNLQGRAVADSNAAQQASRQNSAAALAAEGVDPASIHGGALDRQAGIAGAAQNAGVANNAYMQAQDTGRQLVNQANNLGIQVGQLGQSGAATGSNIGAQTVGAETSSNAGQVNNLTAANTYMNTGVNANKSASDISNSAFQNQMTEYNAKQAQSSSTLSSIGQIAGMAAMFMDRGGPVPAKGALPVPPNPMHPTDKVPIMGTPGEFMMPKDVVQHLGNEFFHKLIDKTRLKMNDRKAIPVPVFAHQSNH